MPNTHQQPQIRTRTEYVVLRAKCTPRYVDYIDTGGRKASGTVGKKVKAALAEYDTLLQTQLQKPLDIPPSSS